MASTPVYKSTEFTSALIHLTAEQVSYVRLIEIPEDDTVMDSIMAAIAAALPVEIELTEGMRYKYRDGQVYSIVQLGAAEVILRREFQNSRSVAGDTFPELQSRVRADLQSGAATVIVEVETEGLNL